MPPQFEELRQLSLVEKLQIVEQLWDDIGSSNEPFPIHEWQRSEARRRASELACDPESGLTRDELWKRVDQRNG